MKATSTKIIILLFLVIISTQITSAVNATQAHGVAMGTSTTGTTIGRGMNITIGNTDIYLVNITKDSRSGTNGTVVLYASTSCTLLATATFSGSTATFSPMPLLKNNTKYAVMLWSGSGGATVTFAGTVYPRTNTYLNWTKGIFNSCGTQNDEVNDIESLGISTDAGNGSSVTINSPSNNSAVLRDYNQTFNVSSLSVAGITNVTMYIDGSLNETKSVTGTSNTTFFYKPFGQSGNRTYYFRMCDSSGTCINSSIQTIVVQSYNFNSVTYNPFVLAGSYNNFSTNFSFTSEISGISPVLVYNNTNYTMSTNDNGTTRIYSVQVYAPQVLTLTNKTFYYSFLLTNSTTTFEARTSSYNQSISALLVDNCTLYNTTLINMSMFDEATLLRMNGTIEFLATFYTSDRASVVGYYNNTYNFTVPSTSRVCVSNITGNYSADYEIRHYGNGDYAKKYRNGQNITVSNTTSAFNINLYNLNNVTSYPFTFIVVGNSFTSSGNTDLVVSVQRQYLSLSTFLEVESPVTGNDGEAVGYLLPSTEVYNFIISYMGTTIASFNNYQVKCQNPSISQCTITLNIALATESIPDFTETRDVSFVHLLSNDTLYLTYSSTDGEPHTIRQQVSKDDAYGNTTICNTTTYGSSGTIQCTIPVAYQNTTFYSRVYVDGVYVLQTYFTQGTNNDWKGVNIFIQLLMFSSLTLLLIGHPILLIIGSILGLLIPAMLFYLTGTSGSGIFGGVIAFIILGLVLIWQIWRKS